MLRTVRPPKIDPGIEEAEAADGEDEPSEEVEANPVEAGEKDGAPEVPPPPAPPKAERLRPRPGKRMTVDEPAASENEDVLVKKAQLPVPLADVKVPSPAEVAKHNLTHLPYKRWCRFCVAARCPNLPHVKLLPFFFPEAPAICHRLLLREEEYR